MAANLRRSAPSATPTVKCDMRARIWIVNYERKIQWELLMLKQ